MTWNALTRAEVIARRATVEEIDAMTRVLVRSLSASNLRRAQHREYALIRKSDATISMLERKIANLAEARRLWIEDFKKTENPKETP